jgi:uncharacterized damage-inducible protein DinB
MSDVFVELYGRIAPLVHDVVDGLPIEQLTATVVPETNTIAWLVWHLTRVQDHHIAELRGDEQSWVDGTWHGRFGFAAADPEEHGYGYTPAQVAANVPESAAALTEYHDTVWARTEAYLSSLSDDSMADIVDRRWDPPVTRLVRLVSVADDALQHVGQAAYLKGLLAK